MGGALLLINIWILAVVGFVWLLYQDYMRRR
jgi:hypothetical protein